MSYFKDGKDVGELVFSVIQLQPQKRLEMESVLDKVSEIESKSAIGTMTVNVKIPGDKIITLEVVPVDTIENVKEKIQDLEDVPPKLQRLLLQGKNLADWLTVSDYNNSNNLTLELMLKPHSAKHIFVQTHTNKIITLQIECDDTTANVKERIQEEEGIPPDKQCLHCSGKLLKDELTVSFYNIRSNRPVARGVRGVS